MKWRVSLAITMEYLHRANTGGHNYTLRRQSHNSCTTHVIVHNVPLCPSIHYSSYCCGNDYDFQSSPSPVLVLSMGASVTHSDIPCTISSQIHTPLCSPLPLCSSTVLHNSSYLALLHHYVYTGWDLWFLLAACCKQTLTCGWT